MSQTNANENVVKCYCSIEAAIVTSWKEANVGRRFRGCAKYPNDGYCRFFQCVDTPMCDRSKEIIPSLLKKINDQRIQIANKEDMEEKYKAMLKGLEGIVEELDNEIIVLKLEKARLIIDYQKEIIDLKTESITLRKENEMMKLKVENTKSLKLWVKTLLILCLCLVLAKFWFLVWVESGKANEEDMLMLN
ncbi:hypothetical protein ACS0TY_031437 [Phlomoides rotata]